MNCRVILVILASLHPYIASAGVVEPDTIFMSSFEGAEACINFDAFGDSVSIPYITVSGDFSLNNGPFPGVEYDDAIISFRDRQTGNVFEVGNTHDQSYSIRVVPGHYDVIYEVETAGDDVPSNSYAVIMENIALLTDGTLDVPVTSYSLGGDMTHNNDPFPGSEYDDGIFYLDDDTKGSVELGNSHDGSFTGKNVLPGAYEIRFSVETPGDTVPYNQWGLVDTVNISGNDPAFHINVESIELSGSLLHNGVLMPTVEYDDGDFYLETPSGDRVWLDSSHNQSYDRNVITGSNYDIYWEVETPGDTVPFNQRARIAKNVDISSGKRTIDMNSSAVSGDILMNGSPFPGPGQGNARIVFRDTTTGDDNELLQTADGADYDLNVLRGNYDIAYQYISGQDVPRNRDADLGNITVKADSVRNVNVPARLFSAPVYHNDVLFPLSQLPTASIVFEDVQSDDSVNVGNASSQTVSSLVIEGTYDVYYRYNSGADIPRDDNYLMLSDLVIYSPPAIQAAGGGLQLNIYSVAISGGFYLVDVPTPADVFDSGLVWLRLGSDNIVMGPTYAQDYELRVGLQSWPVRYDVYYGVQNLGSVMPANGETYIGCIMLDPIIF